MLLREDRNKWINVAIKKSHLFTDTESDLKCFKYRSFLGKIWFVCVKEQYFDTGTDWWDAWQWFTLWATRHFILCAKHSMKMFFVTYSVPKKKIWCLFSRAHEALLDKQQVESLNNKTMLPSNGQSLQHKWLPWRIGISGSLSFDWSNVKWLQTEAFIEELSEVAFWCWTLNFLFYSIA